MRIGFDAKRAFNNASGLGNYSRSLIQSLLDYYPENEYVAFTPSVDPSIPFHPPALKIIKPSSLPARLLPSLWRTALLSDDLDREKISLYHGLSNELPRRVPAYTGKVVTIHDLIFLRYPQWYPAADRKIYEKKFSHACRDADVIVAVSEQTKKDIVEFLNIPANKIAVVYQSCGKEFYGGNNAGTSGEFLKQKGLPGQFLLYVGTVEERKNLLTLVMALRLVPRIPLVVIGKKKKYFETVSQFLRAHGMQDRVYFPEGITNAELSMLYRSAWALVYPSYYEGFGIPVIEALWSGTPVIASCESALPEAGGPSSLYIDPDDEQTLADVIRQVLDNAALREKMIRDGLEYVKRFHPKETASSLVSVYKNLGAR